MKRVWLGYTSLHNSFLSSEKIEFNLFVFKIKSFGVCASNLSRFKNHFPLAGLLEQK